MVKCAAVIITGHVQGVSFRYYTQKMASSLDLSGFVKNMSDGSVCIQAQGEEDKLLKFIQWCHKGPQWAKVENVEVNYIDLHTHQSFQIRY